MIKLNTQSDFDAVFTPVVGDPGYIVESADGAYAVWAKNLETARAIAGPNTTITAAILVGPYFKQFEVVETK